jgi:prefoldin subunit 5
MQELEFEETNVEVSPLDLPEDTPKTKPEPSGDKINAELDAYKRHFQALQAELSEIEQKYPTGNKDTSTALEERVSGIEKGMQEIKELLQKQTAPVQNVPQFQPQYQAYPQYQPMYSSPSPVIPPIVTLPYGR